MALVLTLYSLRTALAPAETLSGLRRLVLNAAPLPGIVPVIEPDDEHQDDDELPPTKKAVLLALYRAHGDYGNRALASQVAKELAPKAELQPGAPPGPTSVPRLEGHRGSVMTRIIIIGLVLAALALALFIKCTIFSGDRVSRMKWRAQFRMKPGGVSPPTGTSFSSGHGGP